MCFVNDSCWKYKIKYTQVQISSQKTLPVGMYYIYQWLSSMPLAKYRLMGEFPFADDDSQLRIIAPA